MRASLIMAAALVATITLPLAGQDLPRPEQVKTVELFRVPKYCEGVCFDHAGNGYVSWGKSITRFSLDGKHSVWAETGRRTATRFWPTARTWSATPASTPCCT